MSPKFAVERIPANCPSKLKQGPVLYSTSQFADGFIAHICCVRCIQSCSSQEGFFEKASTSKYLLIHDARMLIFVWVSLLGNFLIYGGGQA
eukprot:scaffold76216_cov17-Tisochrysis_lutea.AAC.1